MLSRRGLVAKIGTVVGLSVAGCSGLGPTSEDDPLEPQETTPVRAKGAPITVTRSVSSFDVTIGEDGAVKSGDGDHPRPLSSLVKSRSVQLAEFAIREALAARVEGYEENPVDCYLQWIAPTSRFRITTTTTVEPLGNRSILWPSRLYDDIESAAPSSVTVRIQTKERAASNEFPVETRARLRSADGPSEAPPDG